MAFVANCSDDNYENWVKTLSKAGLIPPETRRIIIDLNFKDVAKVYYECNADERMFQIDPTKLLKGADVISVTEAAKT